MTTPESKASEHGGRDPFTLDGIRQAAERSGEESLDYYKKTAKTYDQVRVTLVEWNILSY